MPKAPTPVKRYHETLIQTMRDIGQHQKWFTSPLNLAGVTGPGGGSGVPVGGLIGMLIQSKVAYDTTEAESLYTPPSGQSLVDNLNHIRYNVAQRSPNIVVLDEGEQVASGVRELDFIGSSITATLASGYTDRVTIAISGVGGDASSGVLVKVSSDDISAGYLEDKIVGVDSKITVTTYNPGANEVRRVAFGSVELTALSDVSEGSPIEGEVLAYDGVNWVGSGLADLEHDAIKIQGTPVDSDSPEDDDILVYIAGEWTPSGFPTSATNLIVQEDDVVTASGVTTLNFEGSVITLDEGSGKVTVTVSASGEGGADISIEDEGSEITSAVTSIDFVGTQIEATNVGTDVTVTVSGIVIEPPEFIGVKTYLDSDWQLSTSDGWQIVNWDQEEYDTDGLWTSGGNQTVQTAGYYNVIGQVTMSGAMPTAGRFELGVFQNSTVKGKHWDGYYTNANGIYTLHAEAESYYDVGHVIKMEVICEGSVQPYVMSGVANSFLTAHLIQGVFIEGAIPEVCRVVWQNYLGVNDVTDTPIPWDAEDDYDTGDFWDTGDDTKFTISEDGYYNLKATALWETVYYQGVTPFAVRVAFLKNGTTKLGTHWDWNDVNTGGARSEGLSTHISTDAYLEAGDYVEVVVWHDKGSTANGIIRANDTYATIQRLA